MLEIHWCANPVIPHRLVRVNNDGVTLASEDLKSTDRLCDVVDAIDLLGVESSLEVGQKKCSNE